jgi:hypothetical protein
MKSVINQVTVLIREWSRHFRQPNELSDKDGPAGIVVGDFNRDGKLDVATSNVPTSN